MRVQGIQSAWKAILYWRTILRQTAKPWPGTDRASVATIVHAISQLLTAICLIMPIHTTLSQRESADIGHWVKKASRLRSPFVRVLPQLEELYSIHPVITKLRKQARSQAAHSHCNNPIQSKILGITSDRSLHPIGYEKQNAPIDESSIAGVTKRSGTFGANTISTSHLDCLPRFSIANGILGVDRMTNYSWHALPWVFAETTIMYKQ